MLDIHDWVYRKTPDGDVYYERKSRTIYRKKPATIDDDNLIWSLPTFQTLAPLKVYFDFSYLCNLECRHCVTNSSPRADRKSELSTGQITSIIDNLASIGVLELGIGGGEPFCHPDLFALIHHAINLRINIVVTTNGTLVTSAVAEKLKKAGVSEVRVSFDGSEAVHDIIRGRGKYRQALRAVRALIDNGVTTIPRVTLCNDDQSGMDTLFHDLASAGVLSLKVSLIEPHGRAALAENQELFRYPRDATTAVYLMKLARRNSIKLMLPVDLAILPELVDGGALRGEMKTGKRKSCGAGLETAYINPQGTLQPCSARPDYIFGKLGADPFMTVWSSPAAGTWRNHVCTSCTWFSGN